jgi:hypothetical protein
METTQQFDESADVANEGVERPLVLLAEDHDDTRRVYGLILRHFGYRVEEAANGYDAVELAKTWRPDLVLMDIGLPGMDGWQVQPDTEVEPGDLGCSFDRFFRPGGLDCGSRGTADVRRLHPEDRESRWSSFAGSKRTWNVGLRSREARVKVKTAPPKSLRCAVPIFDP